MIQRCWANEEVVKWAKLYTRRKRETLLTLEESLNVSHSTIWWGFQNRLCNLEVTLYLKVMEKLDANRRKGGRKE